jgi:hypothetical protein
LADADAAEEFACWAGEGFRDGDGDALQAAGGRAQRDGGVSGRGDVEGGPTAEVGAVFEDLSGVVGGEFAASEGEDEVRAGSVQVGQDGGIGSARMAAEDVFEKVGDAVVSPVPVCANASNATAILTRKIDPTARR